MGFSDFIATFAMSVTNTLNVMDISRGQITNPSGFIKELKNTVPDIVYFDEKSNGCIHIEIPQP